MTSKQAQIETVEQRVKKLELRLQEGFLRIGEAMNSGVAVENWEKFWIDLLREYAALSDELAATPLAQQEMPGLPRKEAA